MKVRSKSKCNIRSYLDLLRLYTHLCFILSKDLSHQMSLVNQNTLTNLYESIYYNKLFCTCFFSYI